MERPMNFTPTTAPSEEDLHRLWSVYDAVFGDQPDKRT